MNIIIHIGVLPGGQQKHKEFYCKEVFGRLSRAYPQHNFIFLTNGQHSADILKSDNVAMYYAGKMAANPLLWKYWYDIKLPVLLKKYKGDVFIDMEGICSLTTKIPQCILYTGNVFSERKNFWMLKRNIPRFLNKAKKVITLSATTAESLVNIKSDKISVVYPAGRNNFHPLSEEQQSDIKNKYTEDQHYFISGPIHSADHFIQLLKAFSIFKKRQKSSWRLMIAEISIDYAEKLQTYKYREDVTVIRKVREEELPVLVASSYAMICLDQEESFTMPPVEAMQCRIPVIVPASKLMREWYDDAVLYTDGSNVNDIAEKMMQLYKDETFRKELIRKGDEMLKKYSWDQVADGWWQSILKAVQ
jgi:glycosyltransferase involved in cell wall biosynthesis